MKSEVYFAEISNLDTEARSIGLQKLLKKASPFSSFKNGEFIPVKITVGDTKCTYHLHPDLVKTVITEIKRSKTKPFLFDTSVIYTGFRQNAVDHMTLVQNKGFGQSKVGAPFIVADGLFGRDGIEYETGGRHIEKARIPSFIGMVDNLVVLSHVTGHILSGYAGAIKNVAMGMCSRATKRVQHSSIKPVIAPSKCTACGCCIEICPVNAIEFKKDKAEIDEKKCIGCGECICSCKFSAVSVNWNEDPNIFCKRMAEVAKLVLSKFKNTFFINFVFDVSKECDCISTKDEKIICPNIGILASKDPVSVDKATVDLINSEEDLFAKEHLHPSYKTMIEYAAEIGVGTTQYTLIKI